MTSWHGVLEEAAVTLMALHVEASVVWRAWGEATVMRSSEEG